MLDKTNASPSVQVSFRLSRSFGEELSRRAEEEGLSLGEYARKLITDTLQHSAEEASSSQLLLELKADLAQHREALLAQTADVRATLLKHLDLLQKTPPDYGPVLSQLKTIREDVATSVMGILVEIGGLTPDDAQAWVEEKLFS